MSERDRYDVIIVGAGIAGASFAYFLSRRGVGDVLLVEREWTAGCHATGRSAAVAYPLDPHPVIQQLKAPGIGFLRDPPEGFSQHPLLTRCGAMLVLKDPLWSSVQKAVAETATARGVAIEVLPCAEVRRRVPVLNAREFDGALFLPDAARIDVHELLGSYLRGAKRCGVEVRYDLEITGIRVHRGTCTGVVTPRGEIRASRIVDAAGAWAGEIVVEGTVRPVEPAPVQPGGPEILAGSLFPRSIRRAARWADGLCSFSFGPSADEVERQFEVARAAWEREARSKPPRLVTGCWFALGEGAREQMDAYLHRYLGFMGPGAAERLAPTVTTTSSRALKDAVGMIEGLGADELLLAPTTSDPDEVDRVADLLG